MYTRQDDTDFMGHVHDQHACCTQCLPSEVLPAETTGAPPPPGSRAPNSSPARASSPLSSRGSNIPLSWAAQTSVKDNYEYMVSNMECNPKMRLLPTMAMLSWAVVRVASSRSDISHRPSRAKLRAVRR